ncbi:substrate-binding domain-containing protein [Luteolibacter algae]|uniref:Substrate-binding domain-containing protein n=1 Tax=Luteolibacter algae TaxID=454151 RepID=A0ABW5D662_9BACT
MSAQSESNLFRIAILADPTQAYGRNMMRGATRYLWENDISVHVDILERDWPFSQKQLNTYDGFIETLNTDWLSNLPPSKPIISVDFTSRNRHSIFVQLDNFGIGETAANALYEQGSVSFAFYDGVRTENPASRARRDARLKGFRARLIELGIKNIAKNLKVYSSCHADQLEDWIASLRKPTGIFTFNDLGALEISYACEALGLLVPEEVSIVGVDNDRLLGPLSAPPLSSIDPRIDEIAFNAMRLLIDMLGKKTSAALPVPKPRLIARESTGDTSVADESVRKAIKIIQSSIKNEHLSTRELAKRTGHSLRKLEILFKEHLGKTIRDEILDRQLSQFRFLLRTTDLPIEQICFRLSQEPSNFRKSFQRIEGISPGKYRLFHQEKFSSGTPAVLRLRPNRLRLCFFNKLQGKSAFDYIRGVQDYIREFPEVQVKLFPQDPPQNIEDSTFVGSLARFDGFISPPHALLSKSILGKRPVLYLDHQRHYPMSSSVCVDSRECGKMAAEHFITKGHRSFVYCDYLGMEPIATEWVTDQRNWNRYSAFHETIRSHGFSEGAIKHSIPKDLTTPPQWLENLPTPTAIFAFNDLIARHLVELCRRADLKIPQDIAILGIDNDELTCELNNPPLSSIDMGFRRAGYQAVRLLCDMIRDPSPERVMAISVPPYQVIERESTAGIAGGDPVISAAVEFITENYSRKIGVSDIAENCGTSRRSLEQKCLKHLRKTVAAVILETRLSAAKSLLAKSPLRISEISEQCGFRHFRYFCEVFKRQTGMTPRSYRLQFTKNQ